MARRRGRWTASTTLPSALRWLVLFTFSFAHVVHAMSAGSPEPAQQALCGSRNLTVQLKVEMDYLWKPLVPTGAEDKEPGFTPLLCVVHGPNFVLWERGQEASAEIQAFLKTQDFGPMKKNLTGSNGLNKVANWSLSEMTEVPSPGKDFVNVTIHNTGKKNATLVSCIAGVVPSPDWFVGFSAFQMCPEDMTETKLREEGVTIPLRSFDADFDDLDTFLGQSIPATAPGEIHHRFGMGNDLGSARLIGMDEGSANNATAADGTPQREAARATSSPACFPASAELERPDGTRVAMKDLRVRDVVSVGAGASSPVFAFSHQDARALSSFIRATFVDSNTTRTLTASAGHFVYAIVDDDPRLVPLHSLKVGDFLVGPDGHRLRVVQIGETVARGLYNPHTLAGGMVVDGVRVSCYTTAVRPAAAAGALFPIRALYAAGVSSGAQVGGRVASEFRRVWAMLFAGRWAVLLRRLGSL